MSVISVRNLTCDYECKRGVFDFSFSLEKRRSSVFCVPIVLANDISLILQNPTPEFWIYFGGLAGVMLVFTFNLTVMKAPSLRLSLLSFVGHIYKTNEIPYSPCDGRICLPAALEDRQEIY